MDFTPKSSKENPFVKANVVSRILFLWIIPLFRQGKRKDLQLDDLYDPLKADVAGKLGDRLEEEWTKRVKECKTKGRQPSLIGALFLLIGKPYMLSSVSLVIGELFFRSMQPLALRGLIQSFSKDAHTTETTQYLWAAAVSASTIGETLFYHPAAFFIYRLSLRARVALSSLIYRKALRLSTSAAYQHTNVGAIVNLLANDVNRFDQTLIFIIRMPIGCLQLCFFSYLLWNELGLVALAGVGAMLIMAPLQYFNGKLSTKYRRLIAVRTDERGRVMNEIISGIRILKMYAWEKPFSAIIDQLRKLEVSAVKRRLYVRGFYFLMYSSANKIFSFVSILAVLLHGQKLSPDQVFFTTNVFYILSLVWVASIPFAIQGMAEIYVGLDRIRDFLLLEEKFPSPNFITHETKEREEAKVELDSISAQWSQDSPTETLSNISTTTAGDKVVCIVGPCGSGKSSLLQVLLGELPIFPNTGSLNIRGSISYAAQEPWVFAASIRQNILFGRPYDSSRYSRCVHAACLLDDFKQLPYGDNTIVGERGISLSGGQKARVNLARCLYAETDIYLLDDPLSAVDTKVSRHLFEKCIRKELRGKLRILVTHQLQYLPQCDYVIVLKEGKILAQGDYKKLIEDKVDFVSLMASDGESGNDTARRRSSVLPTTSVIPSLDPNFGEGNESEDTVKVELQAVGSVGFELYSKYFKLGRSPFLLVVTFVIFILCQLLLSTIDYFLSFWTNAEVAHQNHLENFETPADVNYLGRNTYVYIYSGIMGAAVLVCMIRSILFLSYTTKIGINAHNSMFASLVHSTMKFFDDNPSGRVMNRFTKDLGSMDELLPPTMLEFLSIFAQMVGVVSIVIVSNYYMAPPAFLIVGLLWIVRGYYIKTTRAVKRIEGIAKSPIFTHSAASYTGLTSIRALNAEPILIEQFDQLQDIHTSAWFLFISSARAFGICCELLSVVLLSTISVSFLLMQDAVPIGNIGLAISTAMTLSGELQYGLRQSAEVENLMTSVERCLEYTDLPSEASLESKKDKKPPSDWPSQGSIQFRNVSMSYDNNELESIQVTGDKYESKLVLKHLTLDIGGGEKIGVVGRTGAGKSSIIQVLFRLTEPRPDGQILIDGIDIGDIGLHDLRKVISIIPQDPVLFSGTMRYNLDPFNEFPDDQLWAVLTEVEMKNAVPALDFKVADGGSNFSVGQRQLVCLARAILRKNRIIVMDEATANVDLETDMLIQRTIRDKFAECTIITVAHRLHSVIDCNKILLLDKGCLMEYDSPHNLLQIEGGSFRGMVEQLGESSASMLRKAAEEAVKSSSL